MEICAAADTRVIDILKTKWLPIQNEVAGSIAQLKCINTSEHSMGHKQEEPLHRKKIVTQLPSWKCNGMTCTTGVQQWTSINSSEEREKGHAWRVLVIGLTSI